MLITASWPVDDNLKSEADEEQAAAVADILELVSQMRNARADATSSRPRGWRRSSASNRPIVRRRSKPSLT